MPSKIVTFPLAFALVKSYTMVMSSGATPDATNNNEGKMKLYDSDTSDRLTPASLGITRQQYEAIISMSQGVAGEGHVRPDCLRDTQHPRVYAA